MQTLDDLLSPYVPPITEKLRPYQQECYDKFGPDVKGALIADDMGLGKTVEAIARDYAIRQSENSNLPTLVVCPLTGVVDSWVRHFREFTNLRVVRVDPKNRFDFLNIDADIYVCHWDALPDRHERLSKQDKEKGKQPRLISHGLASELSKRTWLHIIADEAHRIKNRKSKTTKSFKTIKKVKYKTALTGTPAHNYPQDIWSILHWLYPTKQSRQGVFNLVEQRLLNSYWRWFTEFVNFIEDDRGFMIVTGPRNTGRLRKMIEPIYLRRDKKTALPNLKDPLPVEYEVTLYPEQQRAYDDMKNMMVSWIGEQSDQALAAPIVLAQRQRMQQFALAYAHLDKDDTVRLTEPSSKIDALVEIANDTDEHIVVFSQFSKMIDLIEQRMKKNKISFTRITGKESPKARSKSIDDFQAGKHKIIGCTIGAGGVGIELTRASIVVFTDRHWVSSENEQAISRAHRSGQENVVTVIDLIARGTVDRSRNKKIQTKQEWIEAVVG